MFAYSMRTKGLHHMEKHFCIFWEIPSILWILIHTSWEHCRTGLVFLICCLWVSYCAWASIDINGAMIGLSIWVHSKWESSQSLANLAISNYMLYSSTRVVLIHLCPLEQLSSFILGFFPSQRKSLIILLYCLNSKGEMVTSWIHNWTVELSPF